MRVLLVYPKFPDTYWNFKHALAFEGKRSAFPPLGLLTISSMLPANSEKRLVDLNIEPLTSKDLDWADIVFLSAMLVQKESLEDVMLRCPAQGKPIRTIAEHRECFAQAVMLAAMGYHFRKLTEKYCR